MNKFAKHLSCYGVAHLGKSLVWSFFNTFFMFYAIYGLGLRPIEAGFLIFLFSISDSVFDIPVSMLIYRSQHKITMSHWVNIAMPLCSILLVLMFITFYSKPTTPDFFKWIIMGLLFKLAFTFIDIPLNASVGRFEYNTKKRNYIAGSRSIASTISKFIIASLIVGFVEKDMVIETDRLWIVATVIAILAPVLILPTFGYIDKTAQVLDARYKYHSGEIQFKNAFKVIPINLKLLICANFFLLALVSQLSNGLIFLIDGNPKFDISFTIIWQFMAVISAISVIFWMYLAGKIKKNIAAVISLFLLSLLLLFHSLFFTSTIGLFLFVGIYAAIHHVNSLMWSMLPDTADEISEQLESNMQVPTIGIFAAFGKSMIGLGLLISGFILELSGFPDSPNISLFTNLIAYFSLSGCIGAFICFAFFKNSSISINK